MRRAILVVVLAVLVAGFQQSKKPNPYALAGGDWRPRAAMHILEMPGGPDDYMGCLSYNWGWMSEHNLLVMPNPDYRVKDPSKAPKHWYNKKSDTILDEDFTRDWIKKHPNKVWIIGNEPDNKDLEAGDGMETDEYARMYHKYWTVIKEVSPETKVAVGAPFASTDKGGLEHDKKWWGEVFDSYKKQFGKEMEVDIWNIHAYTPVGALNPERIIKEFIVPYREWIDTFRDGRHKGIPLWCTEFGVAMWGTPLAPELQAEFIAQLCPRMERAPIDRWFWFLGVYTKDIKWQDSCLITADRKPSITGEVYRRLARNFPNNKVPEMPAKPGPPPPKVEHEFHNNPKPWARWAGDWIISSGAYRQTRVEGPWGMKAYLPYWYTDVRITGDVKIHSAPEDKYWVGFCINAGTMWDPNPAPQYLAYIRKNGAVGLSKHGAKDMPQKEGVVKDMSKFHRLQFEAVGNRLKVSVDGETVIEWEDPDKPPMGGYVCLQSGKSDCSFDNVVVEAVDTTPPVAGKVKAWAEEDKQYGGAGIQLKARWTGFKDEESGIEKYEWAVGTSPGGEDIKKFKSVGKAVTASQLLFKPPEGKAYFVTVRASNAFNLSVQATSEGVK